MFGRLATFSFLAVVSAVSPPQPSAAPSHGLAAADTAITRLAIPAARASHAQPDPHRQRATRRALLAAARRLSDPGHARSRQAHAARPGDDSLRQSLARCAARISGCSSSRTSADRPASPKSSTSRRWSFSARCSTSPARDSPAVSSSRASRVGLKEVKPAVYGTTMRLDLARPLAPGRFARHEHRLAVHRPGLRCRTNGARRGALRDGTVVSAHGGVRRRARLESRSVHRRRRVLPRVRTASTSH